MTGGATADIATQVSAVRGRIAVARRDDLALLRATGADAVDFLHRVVSVDVRSLAAGAGAPAALLTVKARVLAAMTILRQADDVLLLGESTNVGVLREQLERYVIIDDVQLVDDTRRVLGLYGPGVADREALSGVSAVAARAAFAHGPAEVCEVSCLAVADDQLASPGALLIVEAPRDEALVEGLVADGATLVGADAVEICRVEAGTPRMGRELGEDVLILEAGQLARVAFDKGCYIGQEPVCRVHSRGRVQRHLVGLSISGERVPGAREGLSASDRDAAGWVTSAVRSPGLGRIVALGYVHRSCAATGASLRLEGGGEAVVVELPHVPSSVQPTTLPRYSQPSSGGG